MALAALGVQERFKYNVERRSLLGAEHSALVMHDIDHVHVLVALLCERNVDSGGQPFVYAD